MKGPISAPATATDFDTRAATDVAIPKPLGSYFLTGCCSAASELERASPAQATCYLGWSIHCRSRSAWSKHLVQPKSQVSIMAKESTKP